MKKNEIEKKLRTAFTNNTPDLLDSILSLSEGKKGKKIIMEGKKERKIYFMPKIMKLVAIFMIAITGVLYGFDYMKAYSIDTVISLDINPSIEINVNKNKNVISVTPLNDDAKKVVGDMDFKGSSIDVTINAIIGSMLRNGYLSDLSNSILISVNSRDQIRGEELQKKLVNDIDLLLSTDQFKGAILSQSISQNNNNIKNLSDKYGITTGKAELIQQIISKNQKYTFDNLSALSVNELNLLSKNQFNDSSKILSTGTPSDKLYIGYEQAKEIALLDAKATNIYDINVEFDYEYGQLAYEVEFSSNGFEYNYYIDAVTGKIIDIKKEFDDDYIKNQQNFNNNNMLTKNTNSNINTSIVNANPESSIIDKNTAKEISTNHAGVSNIYDYEIELDKENGVNIYEIEFKSGNYEYSYEINAITGAIIKYKREID